ncbi:MAG: hypothetical protein KC620_02865 [Myxococcales bacterium]|nr:hypothetical protein [Myxococcales bacterium]
MDLFNRFINVRQLPPGRLRVAAEGVRAEAARQGDAALVTLCVDAITAANVYLDLRTRRRAQRGGRSGGRARLVDQRVDAVVMALYRTLVHTARTDAGTPIGDLAQQALNTLLPEGANPVTKLPYEEELIAVELLVTRLRADFGADLDAMNIAGWLTRLDALLPEYREVLALEALIHGADLAAARARMQSILRHMVAHVLGHYAAEGETEKREALLAPVVDQDDRVAEMLIRRRQGQGGGLDVPTPPDLDAPLPPDRDDALLDDEDAVDLGADRPEPGDGPLPDPDAD